MTERSLASGHEDEGRQDTVRKEMEVGVGVGGGGARGACIVVVRRGGRVCEWWGGFAPFASLILERGLYLTLEKVIGLNDWNLHRKFLSHQNSRRFFRPKRLYSHRFALSLRSEPRFARLHRRRVAWAGSLSAATWRSDLAMSVLLEHIVCKTQVEMLYTHIFGGFCV